MRGQQVNMQNYEGMVEDVRQLLRIDSVGGKPLPLKPFGKGCADALDYLLSRGEAFGFSVKNVDGYAGHIEFTGKDKQDIFGILCHLDVVPVGDGWTADPFGGELRGGYIYGRGAQDDKAPAVAALYALKRLRDEGFAPKRTARLILGLNEESGWKCIDYYAAHERMPESGFSPDSDFPVITAEKGVLHLKLMFKHGYDKIKDIEAGQRVNMVPDKAHVLYYDGVLRDYTGTAAHGAHPEQGDSALHKLLLDVANDSGDPVLIDIAEKFILPDGKKRLGLDLSDEESGALTTNLGTAKGNKSDLVLGLDVRYPVTVSREVVLEKLRALGCTVEIMGEHAPLYVAKDDPLVVSLLAAYEEVTGEKAQPLAIGGATFARALKKGVAFGPVFPDEVSTIHGADERISADSLYAMTEIYYVALKKLLG